MKKISPIQLAAGVLALAAISCNLTGSQDAAGTETAQAQALAISQAAETAAAGTQIALAQNSIRHGNHGRLTDRDPTPNGDSDHGSVPDRRCELQRPLGTRHGL